MESSMQRRYRKTPEVTEERRRYRKTPEVTEERRRYRKTPELTEERRYRKGVKRKRYDRALKAENITRYPIVPIGTVLVAAVIITIVLFMPPYIGMEDNGDYARVTYCQGLYDLPENSELLYNGYFIKEYGIMQYYNEYSSTVFTSQAVFIQPAIWLDKLFTGNDNIFDLRFLGIVMSIYFLAVLYFLVEYFTHRLSLISQLTIAAACLFIFVDTGYTAYFNSFFAEPLAYISLLACITCALLYAEGRYNQYVLLAGFVLNGILLTLSKQQLAPIGAVLGILCLFFYMKAGARLFKWLVALSSAALVLSGILTYMLISTEFTNINLYHSLTRGVLMTSEDPPDTLESFDIDSQYELLNQTIYFDRYPVIDPEDVRLQENLYSKYNIFSIVKHYVTHPGAFMEMMKLAAQSAYRIRPDLGNYEYNSGYAPNEKAQIFSVYSNLKQTYTPKTTGFIVIWMVVVIALLYKKRMKQIIVGALILIGLSQIIVPIIGAGDADLAKHMFLYNVAFDTVNIIILAHIVAFIDKRYKVKKAAAVNNQVDIMNEISIGQEI